MRIRSIKPEFWRSEDITALDWETRLLFVGLWSYVDDNGVGRDNEKLILADLFALEDDPRETLATVSRGLQTLFGRGLIARYSVDGTPLLHITNWDKHQRIDKPNKARYEPPTCGNAVIRDIPATPSRDPRETPAPGAGEQGNRGTEEQGRTTLADKSADASPPPRFEEFWDTYGLKVKRPAAERAWVKAMTKTTPDVVISAAAAYVLRLRMDRERRGDRATQQAHASTWLNDERWNDDPGPIVAPPRTNMQAHMALVEELGREEHYNVSPFRQLGGGR